MDSCLQFVEKHRSVDPEVALQFFIKFSGIAKKTPRERIAAAVGEELLDLCNRALEAIVELPRALKDSPLTTEATSVLSRALQAGAEWDAALAAVPDGVCFPREALEAIRTRAAGADSTRTLALMLDGWIEKHRALERRLE